LPSSLKLFNFFQKDKLERIIIYNITHMFLTTIKYEITWVPHLLPLNPKNNSSHLLWCHLGFAPNWCPIVSMVTSLLPWTSLFGFNILLHLSKKFSCHYVAYISIKLFRIWNYFSRSLCLLLCIFFEMAHCQNFSNHFILYQPPPNKQKYVIFQW